MKAHCDRVTSGTSNGAHIKPSSWSATGPCGEAWIYAICNAHSSAAGEISFPTDDQDGLNEYLDDVNVGPASSVSFASPIRCTSFVVANSSLSIVWRDVHV